MFKCLGAWACMSVPVHKLTVGVGCLLLYQGSLLLNLELTNSRQSSYQLIPGITDFTVMELQVAVMPDC